MNRVFLRIEAQIIVFILFAIFTANPFLSPIFAQKEVLKKSTFQHDASSLNDSAEALLDSDPDRSIIYAKQSLELGEGRNDHIQKACSQRIIADALYYKADYLKAIDFYKASAETEKSVSGKMAQNYQKRLSDVGFCYMKLAIYEKAIEYYLLSLEIARERNDIEEIASNLNNLGYTAFCQGNYKQAISFFDQTLQIDRERKNDENISIDLNNIGKVYFSWKKYDKSLEYYQESLNMAIAAQNENMQAVRLSNIGQVYESMDEIDKALDYLNQALELDQKLGNTEKVGIRQSHLGVVYLKQGKYQEAYENFTNAIGIFERSNNIPSKIITLNHLGDLMNARDMHDEALSYFYESLKLSRRLGLRAQQMRSAKSISNTYKETGDFEKSLKYFETYTQLKDSIFNDEKHRQLAEFEARYETEKKEKENELLRQDANIQRKQKIIFIVSGIALLLLAVSFIILFTGKRKSLIQSRILHDKENQLHQLDLEKKEKENQHLQDVLFAEEQINKLQTEKLQQKNRELSTATVHILNKNEVLGNIRKMAANWMRDEDFDKTKNMEKLIREVENNTDLDEQWNQFKLHFESVHKGFFERLMQKYPTLTQNELKLCAYLRMNLSTKEIAQMLNIGTESVTTKRYRLRKKLALDKEENLVGFIGGF